MIVSSSRLLLGAWLLLAMAWSGCDQASQPCPDKALVVVVNVPETVTGDGLKVDVLDGQSLLRQGTVARPSTGTRGRIEIDLGDAYVPGDTLRVSISPVSAGALQGRTEAAVTLAPTCSRLEMTVTNDKPAPDWSCVGMVDLVTRRTGESDLGQYRFVDMLNAPLSGVEATACADLDVTCQSPLWQDVTQAGVLSQKKIHAGFDGFIALSAPGFYPAMLDLTRCAGIMNARPVIVLISPETLQLMATMTGEALLLQERGSLILATFDCRGYRVGGVGFTFTAAPAAAPEPRAYVLANNWYPDRTLDATDDTGTAIISNLPPGMVRITAIHKATGTVLADFSTRIVAGTMTYVAVEPN